jgi:hypothetical protein
MSSEIEGRGNKGRKSWIVIGADIFMAERDTHEIARNELVSMFLQFKVVKAPVGYLGFSQLYCYLLCGSLGYRGASG